MITKWKNNRKYSKIIANASKNINVTGEDLSPQPPSPVNTPPPVTL